MNIFKSKMIKNFSQSALSLSTGFHLWVGSYVEYCKRNKMRRDSASNDEAQCIAEQTSTFSVLEADATENVNWNLPPWLQKRARPVCQRPTLHSREEMPSKAGKEEDGFVTTGTMSLVFSLVQMEPSF